MCLSRKPHSDYSMAHIEHLGEECLTGLSELPKGHSSMYALLEETVDVKAAGCSAV